MIKPTPQSYFSPVPKLAGDLAGTRFEGHPEVFCQMVPKAETHLHGGAMVPLPVAWDIASRRMARTGGALQLHGRTFKSLEDVRELYANPRQRSLPAYLDAYAMLSKHLFTNEADIEEVAYQGAMQAARHGVSLLEIRTSIKSGFATEFFPESDPEQAMFTHLEHWRKTLRRKHHIPNQVIEVIEEKRNELSLKKA
jgi:hypothetical protein